MIPSKISFETGFENSGMEYGDIKASGNIRNILSAIITYFRDINPNGHTDTHHGCTINLIDYGIRIVIGQFGDIEKSKNNYLGIIFDGSGHWYANINKHGNSEHKERVLTIENKEGIIKILEDIIGDNIFKRIWNHEGASIGFSTVLNINVNWTQHKHNAQEYKEEIVKMVDKLNSLAKSFSAVTNN